MAKKIKCKRSIEFDYGHRVLGHLGRCNNMHGHRAKVIFHAKSSKLNELGMVIDFGIIKEKIGKWIDENWDHSFIYYENDNEVYDALKYVKGQHKYELPFNPTAENLASYLLDICKDLFKDTGVKIYKIEFCETPNCSAVAKL